MTRVRTRGEKVRDFIITHVRGHPGDIARATATHFGISRQAVNKHLRHMLDERVLVAEGVTRTRRYRLAPSVELVRTCTLEGDLAEDIVWREVIFPAIGQLPDNATDIWNYGFTEMLNNAIDHSAGRSATILLRKDAAATEVAIADDGIGIFRKLQTELGLLDERHAVLELAKGKLTTDPDNHTGEGIFFTSRMFDEFDIMSGGVYFSHKFGEREDWILERAPRSGTIVWMRLHNHTSRSVGKVFDHYTTGGEFRFNKTVVPVRLAQYGDDKLVSRSQAKRLLARIERFKVVIFDFQGVASIGQAFADEIFRVFARKHPDLELVAMKANAAVKRVIQRARS